MSPSSSAEGAVMAGCHMTRRPYSSHLGCSFLIIHSTKWWQLCCWHGLAFHLVILRQELCTRSQLLGNTKITQIIKTYLVSLCCRAKHPLGLQDTSNCWCQDACSDKLFLENNRLGSNFTYQCQMATCAYTAGNTGLLILLTSPQSSFIFACYYHIGLINIVYSTPEFSPLNVRWEHWLCKTVHMRL